MRNFGLLVVFITLFSTTTFAAPKSQMEKITAAKFFFVQPHDSSKGMLYIFHARAIKNIYDARSLCGKKIKPSGVMILVQVNPTHLRHYFDCEGDGVLDYRRDMEWDSVNLTIKGFPINISEQNVFNGLIQEGVNKIK